MPELAEVEYARLLLEQFLPGNRIVSVTYPDEVGIQKRFIDTEPKAFSKSILNRQIESIKRHGKYLWFEMSDGLPPYPIFHFGMSGGFRVKNAKNVTYLKSLEHVKQQKVMKKTVKNEIDGKCESFLYDSTDSKLQWPPRFTRIEFRTSNSYDISFTDMRKFARFYLITNSQEPLKCLPLSKLGFDPYLNMPTLSEYKQLLSEYRPQTIELKAFLLDQTFSCGIGNWLADEILYHSYLHPRRRLNSLTENEIDVLHSKIVYVICTAVEKGSSEHFPSEWLFHFRWTNKKTSQTHDGLEIKFDTVGGRTSAYVPVKQVLSKQEQEVLEEKLSKRKRQNQMDAVKVKRVKSKKTTNENEDQIVIKDEVQTVISGKDNKIAKNFDNTHEEEDVKLKQKPELQRLIPLRQRACKEKVAKYRF